MFENLSVGKNPEKRREFFWGDLQIRCEFFHRFFEINPLGLLTVEFIIKISTNPCDRIFDIKQFQMQLGISQSFGQVGGELSGIQQFFQNPMPFGHCHHDIIVKSVGIGKNLIGE